MAVKLPKQTILFLPELFKAIESNPDREDKLSLIHQYINKCPKHTQCFRAFVELLLHPDVHFDLPESAPPYTQASETEDLAPNNLFRVFREVGRFLKGSSIYIQKNLKREFYYITLLESMSVRESKIFIAVKDKNITSLYPSLTNDLLCEAVAKYNWLPQSVIDANPPQIGEPTKK